MTKSYRKEKKKRKKRTASSSPSRSSRSSNKSSGKSKSSRQRSRTVRESDASANGDSKNLPRVKEKEIIDTSDKCHENDASNWWDRSMLLIARSSHDQKAAFECIRQCEIKKYRYFDKCEKEFQSLDQKVMEWLLGVLPGRLKTKVETAAKRAQRNGTLINGRQGLHITRRAMRSYGEETILDERKKFEHIMPRGDLENGKWNIRAMIEFRERYREELETYRDKPSSIEKVLRKKQRSKMLPTSLRP